MSTEPVPASRSRMERTTDTALVLSGLRSMVGALSWAAPSTTWRTFGLGSMQRDPRAALVTRLFGARELALGLAVQHPDKTVRRTALQAGVVIDAADIAVSLVALKRGAPKAITLTFVAGASLFVALGLTALARDAEDTTD